MAEDYRLRSTDDATAIDQAYREVVRQIRQQGLDIATHFPDLPEPSELPTLERVDVDSARQRGLV